jgi:tRNA(Ile2) C34 agmatinyltransferase TiaS
MEDWLNRQLEICHGEPMERVMLQELGFNTRDEAMAFLKKLWQQEKTECPICGEKLELLHKKAKKSDCDWQCRNCNKIYRTMHLLNEINEQMPE